jgi:uncharacterized SAM-binding protein YcdF (DUF218 family)
MTHPLVKDRPSLHGAIGRSRRRIVVLLVMALAGTVTVAAISLPGMRAAILRTAGWALIAEDPLEPADMIVLTTDAGPGGLLEAADLVHRGTATRVAVFADPPDHLDRELITRGVPYEDAAVRSIRQLRFLGVANVEQIPYTVDGTEDESRVLPVWVARRAFSSVVVVSTPDHSRRVRRVLRRAMKDRHTKMIVRYARRSQFDPDRWWQSRPSARTGIIELQKLLLDVALHPLS